MDEEQKATGERPDIGEVLEAAARAGDTDRDVELYDQIPKPDAPEWLREQLADEGKEREFDEWLRRHFLLPGNAAD